MATVNGGTPKYFWTGNVGTNLATGKRARELEMDDGSGRRIWVMQVDGASVAVDEDDEDAGLYCEACGCLPAEGVTPGCTEPAGCGFFQSAGRECGVCGEVDAGNSCCW